MIRGHQDRLQEWDELLVNAVCNALAPPMKSKTKLDPQKMRLYSREGENGESKLKDPKQAAAFLKNIRR